jgi:hypothetical protein
MAKLLGAELFCTREPYLVGEEVFSSQKRKANILLGFEGELHRPDKVNFSHHGLRPGPTELTMLVVVYPIWWKSSLPSYRRTKYPTT